MVNVVLGIQKTTEISVALKWSTISESNRPLLLGRQIHYHYVNGALNWLQWWVLIPLRLAYETYLLAEGTAIIERT